MAMREEALIRELLANVDAMHSAEVLKDFQPRADAVMQTLQWVLGKAGITPVGIVLGLTHAALEVVEKPKSLSGLYSLALPANLFKPGSTQTVMIEVIKHVRNLTGWELKTAKDAVDARLVKGLAQTTAEKLKAEIEKVIDLKEGPVTLLAE